MPQNDRKADAPPTDQTVRPTTGNAAFRNVRILLMILLIPFAPRLGPYAGQCCAGIHRIWADATLNEVDAVLFHQASALKPLHREVGHPKPGDWLATEIEPGQSFAQYTLADPVRPDSDRSKIYVLPLGEFTSDQKKIVQLCAEYLELYFCTNVILLPVQSDSIVPADNRRIHPLTGEQQFCSGWFISEELPSRLPPDGLLMICLTATDLWPGGNSNFVFGQAALRQRVGIWSMARFGAPEIGEAEFTECLKRTLGTATHETGHMLSMKHCIFFECNMSGSGSLEEADRHPLHLCPQCLAKLHWSLKPNPAERFLNLERFCRRNRLETEANYYSKAAVLLP